MEPQTNEENDGVEEELTTASETAATNKHSLGVIFIMVVAVICLIIVGWFVVVGMMQSGGQNNEVAPPTATPDTEVTPELESNRDERDPDILGLRSDPGIGTFFIHPETEQTLYINRGECDEACQSNWTPYLADAPLGQERSLGTILLNGDGTLQYSWEGRALYLFNDDTDGSVLGDRYESTWRIARP